MVKWRLLITTVLVCELAGLIGSLFTFSSIPTWYVTLTKPAFTPPNWIFGPVWAVLYALMGISAYLVYLSKNNSVALNVFGVQLALNVFWSLAFFGLHSTFFGLVTIILLWISILATILKFYSINRTAAWLLIPYLLWVTFALTLNYGLWVLN